MSHLTIGEEQLCWKNWVDCRDPLAGDILVKKYIPLVSYHVQRISVSLPKNVSRDDIRSLGMMGLFDAWNVLIRSVTSSLTHMHHLEFVVPF